LVTQDVELILAITFRKDQGLARRKGKKERVTPEFGERKEEKILPPNSGHYRFTPFRLLYGSEAMTPQEIKHGSPRTVTSSVPDVDEPTSKDLIDGDRVFALQALNKYQAQTKAWRDHTVIPREFSEGDLVLVRAARTESRGKLEPKWEGPFIVKTKASPSAYRLTTPSGEDLEHSWNIDNLRNFFV
jgi:hypothetical protein